MSDYEKLSNFNPKANFNMVRFREDSPVTEYELNELQQLQEYKRKQLATKLLNDGFTNFGEITHGQPIINNEGCIKDGVYTTYSETKLVKYSGSGWINMSINGQVARQTNVSGSTIEFEFYGTSIYYYSPKRSDRGICKIYIDDEFVEEVDGYSPTVSTTACLFSRDNLPLGRHKFKIEVTGRQHESATDCYVGLKNVYVPKLVLSDEYTLKNADLIYEGQGVHISSITTPLEEGQTAYLKLFEQEVSKDSDIKEYGNVKGESLANNLLDPRLMGVESARRNQICYDIETRTESITSSRSTPNRKVSFSGTSKDKLSKFSLKAMPTYENLSPKANYVANDTSGYERLECINMNNYVGLANTTYTCFNLTNLPIRVAVNDGSSWLENYTVPANSRVTFSRTNSFSIGAVLGYYSDGWTKELMEYFKSSLITLKGTYYSWTSPYFKDIYRHGDDGILLMNMSEGEDILPKDLTFKDHNFISCTTGEFSNANVMFKGCNEYIEINPEDEYLFYNINLQFGVYDANKTNIPMEWESIMNTQIGVHSNQQSIFKYKFPENARYIRINIPMINPKPYAIYRNPKYKANSIFGSLRRVPNGVMDEIYEENGKLYKILRCGEYTINTGKYYNTGTARTNTIDHCILVPNLKTFSTLSSRNVMCDNYKVISQDMTGGWTLDEEYITTATSHSGDPIIVVSILKSRLNSNFGYDFDTFVRNNPITVVFERDVPLIVEIPDFNLDVFDGVNNFSISEGSVTFKHTSFTPQTFDEGYTYIPLAKVENGEVVDLRVSNPNALTYVGKGWNNEKSRYDTIKVYYEGTEILKAKSTYLNDTTIQVSEYDLVGRVLNTYNMPI